jgi:hypothetical protein
MSGELALWGGDVTETGEAVEAVAFPIGLGE